MKGLISSSLFALVLTTATAATAAPVSRIEAQNTQLEAPMVFNFNAPIVTNSGVRGNNHFIRIAVIGMSLQDLMISIPAQMERYNGVRITDQMGNEIAAKTQVSKNRLSFTFDKPVMPGGYLEVVFSGVQMDTSGGDTLLYGITAQRVGLTGEIPVGTARIQIPTRG